MFRRPTLTETTFSLVISYFASIVTAGALYVLAFMIVAVLQQGLLAIPGIIFYGLIVFLYVSMTASFYALLPTLALVAAMHALRLTGPISHALGAATVAGAVALWFDWAELKLESTWLMMPCAVIGGVVFWRVWNVSQAGWSKP